jgi:DNA repair exonuclease SbcCD ATPase subunit
VVRHSERVAAHEREVGVLEARTARAKALKELDGNLRRLRGHVIQEVIAPLQTEAETILATMDPGKKFRFIFERGNASTLELCFVEDGVTRLFDAASKGERVMLCVAFLGALLAVINPPMRLLVIDDLEQLDDDRRRRLMVGLVELRDRFDGVIVAGACEFGEVPGWDLVDLELLAVPA